MIIAIHNHKGGIGKTTICAHTAFRASELGIRTLAVTLDRQGDLLRWFDEEPDLSGDIPVQHELITGLYSPEIMPPQGIIAPYPLTLIDTPPQAGMVDEVDPDLWIVPVDNRTSIENLATVIPVMISKAPTYIVYYCAEQGGQVTLRALRKATKHIPKVEFHPEIIPRHGAIFRTQSYYLPIWKVPYGEGIKPHRMMVNLCDAILERAGVMHLARRR